MPLRYLLLLLTLITAIGPSGAEEPHGLTDEGRVLLHFFWSDRCSHCLEAKPVVERLAAEHDWLTLRAYQINGHPAHIRRYVEMAARLGREARSVPAFFFCDTLRTGFTSGPAGETELLDALQRCRRGEPVEAPPTLFIGGQDTADWSLPLLTVTLAALDAFNPCAFFVLLFLLSLLVHLKSRARMALVGGLFVVTSGLLYFLFMAAWLNLFLLAGELRAVTIAAGVLALVIAVLNIKDFYRPQSGPSLSMDERAKGRLFQRTRELIRHSRWPALLGATVLLAVAANSYELLCTAGFPMAYTRILTLRGLEPFAYYVYLALYNLIYVVPLALITALFTWKLGSRKLGEREGRLLKLASGTMMGALGAALLAAPALLTQPWGAIALVIAALAITAALAVVDRKGTGNG